MSVVMLMGVLSSCSSAETPKKAGPTSANVMDSPTSTSVKDAVTGEPQCLKERKCSFSYFPRGDRLELFPEPNTALKPTIDDFRMFDSDDSPPSERWLQLWAGDHGGWARREDVYSLQDFRPVIGCWPVKSIHVKESFAYGMDVRIDFGLDGSARIEPEADLGYSGQVFMAGEVFAILAYGPEKPWGLNASNWGRLRGLNELDSSSYPEARTRIEWYPADQIKGCVAPTTREMRAGESFWERDGVP